jgi:hypothetical protein
VPCSHHPQSLTRICRGHVVVQPDGRRCSFVSESHHELAATRAFHMNVRWLVFSRRGVDIDAERALVVHLDHAPIYNPALGYVQPSGGVPNRGLLLTLRSAFWARVHVARAAETQVVRRTSFLSEA